jgi:Tfp pilus assembly protein PilX
MRRRRFHKRGEDGATLIFVIGFMVLVGFVSAGLATQLATSSKTHVALDQARNKQYAADAAITSDIATVRTNMTASNPNPPNALAPCPSSAPTKPQRREH